MTDDNPRPPCPAPWCGKPREECSHVECWRRVRVTAAPPDSCGTPRLTDEYLPPDER